MKLVSKAEFIAKIESELPDDALIVGFSTMGGEAFECDQTGDVFQVIDDEIRSAYDFPADATHIFETT